jgi:hypothetical protein
MDSIQSNLESENEKIQINEPLISKWSYEYTDTDCDPTQMEQNEYLYFTRKNKETWPNFNPEIIRQENEKMNLFVQSLEPSTIEFTGRGIVFTR